MTKLVRVKRYFPKWNGNRKAAEADRGWVEFNPSCPVEDIERIRSVEEQTALETSRWLIEFVRKHIVRVGGWEGADGAKVETIDGFLALCDVELFREVRDAISGSTDDDEEEIKN